MKNKKLKLIWDSKRLFIAICLSVICLVSFTMGFAYMQDSASAKDLAKSQVNGEKGGLIQLNNNSKIIKNSGFENQNGIVNLQKTGSQNENITSDNRPVYPKYYEVKDNWVYYLSHFDFSIYRVKTDGSQKQRVTGETASYIGIVLLGNYIYFIDSSDHERLYRVSLDGKSTERITGDKIGRDFEGFFKWRGNLYYFDNYNNLHKISSTGENVNLNKEEKNIVENFSIWSKEEDDYIYKWSDLGISRLSLRDGSEEVITKDKAYNLNLKNGWIYYTNYKDFGLYRIGVNGENRRKISGDKLVRTGGQYDLGNFYIADNFIFYIDYSNLEHGTLYRTDLNGKNKVKLADAAEDLLVTGKYVYYMDKLDKGTLYRTNYSGLEKSVLSRKSFTYFIGYEQNIIFYGVKSINEQEPFEGRLFMINSDGKNETELK